MRPAALRAFLLSGRHPQGQATSQAALRLSCQFPQRRTPSICFEFQLSCAEAETDRLHEAISNWLGETLSAQSLTPSKRCNFALEVV